MTPEQLPQTRNAHELLSKPTLELSDADVEAIVSDLRQRRERYLQGVQDKPQKKPKAAATPEEIAARTQSLLEDL